MAARASVRGARLETGVMFAFIALIAAFFLGGTGGYLIRGLTLPPSAATTYTAPRPFVVEQAPYSSPATSPIPAPTLDPKGFVVPI